MDKFFKISERGSNVRTEIIAGLTTFFAMAYIVITNPDQLATIKEGNEFIRLDPIWNAVYVASLIAAVIGTLLMALYAKMPFAQACGMGLNSFFFVSFVSPAFYNGDPVPGYQAGLVIILLSGLVFLILTVTGLRSKIARALPDCLKKAIPAGIGLFIALVGLKSAGIIESHDHTLVQLNDFHGHFVEGKFVEASLPAILAIVGLLLIAVLEKLKVKGAILISIISVTVWFYVFSGTTLNFDMSQVGQAFQDFGAVGITGVFQGSSWQNAFDGFSLGGILSAVMLIITFCLVDMFDTIGTLYGTASQANMLDKNGDPINVDKCMTCDSVATVAGATLGTSTCTTFVESAAGVGVGGRTGLASVVTAICFFLCLFLTPIAQLVPPCATAPALIYVGVLMLKGFSKVDMTDVRSAVPAFLALVMMPLTYSISNGIGVGCIAYTLITLFTCRYTKKDIPVTIIAALFLLRFALVTM